jgi:ATP-dependent DNA helicase RecQ
MAEGQQVPPYIIFSDKTLHEMCRRFPLTLSDMRKISGVGDSKLERYGKDFIREIGRYLDEKSAVSGPAAETWDSGRAGHGKKRKKGETVELTYELFKGGLSLEDIAKLRGLTSSTIASHMEFLVMDGHDVDTDRLVGPAKRLKIEECFLSGSISSRTWDLNPVVEYFKGEVSYEEARLVRALLLRKRQS